MKAGNKIILMMDYFRHKKGAIFTIKSISKDLFSVKENYLLFGIRNLNSLYKLHNSKKKIG